MSFDPNAKWYQVDVVMPSQISELQRHSLPIWQNIRERPWVKKGVYSPIDRLNDMFCYKDFPDKIQAHIKTTRHDQIEEIRQLSGVAVSNAEPSNIYLISGTRINEEERKEEARLARKGGEAASGKYLDELGYRYEDEIWPRLKTDILDTIKRHNPTALLHIVDNDTTNAIFIKTQSNVLIEALCKLNHVVVEEEAPLTTAEYIAELCREWQNGDLEQQQLEPPRPAHEPETRAKDIEP